MDIAKKIQPKTVFNINKSESSITGFAKTFVTDIADSIAVLKA